MVVALAVIWIGFHILSGGDFLTPRNLWNLSVQSASIAIMATGMVLIIVSRNIDLSVGSLLGFLGYTMAMVQTDWIPQHRSASGFDQPYIWVVALAVGIALGALIGGVQGFIVAYVGVPVVHRHARRLPRLARPDLPLRKQGQTLAPSTRRSSCSAADPSGSLGEWQSWLLGVLALRRRSSCSIVAAPAAPAALRLRRPPDVGRDRRSASSAARRARRGLGRQQLPLAAALADQYARSTASPSRRRPQDPDRDRLSRS